MTLVTTLLTAIGAFIATNLDDLMILILLFSQENLQQRQIVTGQYLGFGLLVLVSLPGFFGGLLMPPAWMGLLGIVPLILGLNRLFEPDEEDSTELALEASAPPIGLLSPQTYGVVALTVANGSDNIAVYGPLLAHCTWMTLAVTLAVFFALVGIWCYAAGWLLRLPIVADLLIQSGSRLVPYLLMGLGMTILWESQTLADRGLTVIASLIGMGYLVSLSQRLRLTAEET